MSKAVKNKNSKKSKKVLTKAEGCDIIAKLS